MGEGMYTPGMEPGNSLVDGRDNYRKDGTLTFLQPGQIKKIDFEFGVLVNRDELQEMKEKILTIRNGY